MAVRSRDATALITRRSLLLASAATSLGAAVAPAAMAALGALSTIQVHARQAMPAGTPITFGHAYAKGDVPAGYVPTITPPGSAPSPVQLDQVNRWSDGSLRFAAHSVRLPNAMSAGQVVAVHLGTSAGPAPSGGAVTPAQLGAASDWKVKAHGFSFGADSYTVAVNDILANFQAWNGQASSSALPTAHSRVSGQQADLSDVPSQAVAGASLGFTYSFNGVSEGYYGLRQGGREIGTRVYVSSASGTGTVTPPSVGTYQVCLYGPGSGSAPLTTSGNITVLAAGLPQPGWGNSPLGGWELVRSGPYCTMWRAWRYLKRDSDGASHPEVKVRLYVAAYPDGAGGFSYEVLPEVRQANAYGPHPGGTAPDPQGKGAHGGIYELWNGNTLVHSWGGAADPNVVQVPPGGVNAAVGQIAFSGFSTTNLKGAGFSVQGASLPEPLPGVPLYLSSEGYLYFGRADGSTNHGAGDPAWRPGETLGDHQARKANGCIWLSLNKGTTAAGAAPRPTRPQGGTVTTADGIRWFQMTAAFSANQPGSFRLLPVPFTTIGSATPLALPSGLPVWQGAAGRERPIIGPDPAYLLRRTRAVTPVDPGGPVPTYDPAFGPPYRTNVPFYLRGRSSWNSTGDAPDDESIGWLGLSPANLALNPLDPVCERVVHNLAWSFSDFQINWDDHRTGRPAHGGTKAWPGFIPNPDIHFYPSQSGHGSPPWPGISDYDNYYQGSYGPLVDSSHMPSPFIMPYLRSAHPFFIDQAISQSFALNNSLDSANRNPTDSTGLRRDYNFLYYWNGEIEARVFAWALRHHGTLDFLMPEDDAARPVVRDMMDGVATYAGVVEAEHLKNAFGRNTSFGATKLGLLNVADGASVTDPVNHDGGTQRIHCFMYAHLGTSLFMEQWRGERPGFKAMADVLTRYLVGAYDYPNGTYELDRYSIGCQDAAGRPAYPDWKTLWARNRYGITDPAQGFPNAGSRYGSGDTGTLMLAAIAMRATAGPDERALRVWNAGIAPSRAQGGMPFILPQGFGLYGGHPMCTATYAITPVRA